MALLSFWRYNLKYSYNELSQNLDVQPVLDELLNKQNITDSQYEHIKNQPSSMEQVHHLLDLVNDGSDKLLKSFVQIISEGQGHLANKITGFGEPMSSEHKESLLNNRKKLIHNLVLQPVLEQLLEMGAITAKDKKRFSSSKGDKHIQNAELLDLIIKRPNPVFYMLIDSLKGTNQQHLAALLENKESDNLLEENKILWLKIKTLEEELQNKLEETEHKTSLISKHENTKDILHSKVRELTKKVESIPALQTENYELKQKLKDMQTSLSNKTGENLSLVEQLKSTQKAYENIKVKEAQHEPFMEAYLSEMVPPVCFNQEPELTLDLCQVNQNVKNATIVTALSDGRALVNTCKNGKHYVVQVDEHGNIVPPCFTCDGGSPITGISHSNGDVYILQENGAVGLSKSKLGRLNEKESFQDSYRSDYECNAGSMLNERGQVFLVTCYTKKDCLYIKDNFDNFGTFEVTSCTMELQGPVSVNFRSHKNKTSSVICERYGQRVSVHSCYLERRGSSISHQFKHAHTFGSYGNKNGEFRNPSCAVWMPWGHILVADTDNNRVSEFQQDGKFVRQVLTEWDKIVHKYFLFPSKSLGGGRKWSKAL